MIGNYKLKDVFNYGVVLLFSFTFATFITINSSWIYLVNIFWLKLNIKYQVSETILMKNFYKMIIFIQNPFSNKLSLQKYNLSDNALLHFQNVKSLVVVNNVVLLFTSIILVVLLCNVNFRRNIWRLMEFIKTSWVIIGICFLMVIADFNDIFIYFHEILFRNKDWVFNPKIDPIINVLPDQYFFLCFAVWFLIVIVILGLFYLIGKRQMKRANL